jgi:trans-2,3-dihydro-3-hydroxyanthranilate isomerase
MEFFQVDVFAEAPYRGNPLAVFPHAAGLSVVQMQAIAREMNLSETTFVTSVTDDSYNVRIFTPTDEMPFAGHPTIGTAWVLRHHGVAKGDRLTQRSPIGETAITFEEDLVWLERQGTVEDDLEATDPLAVSLIAKSLGIRPNEIGMEARELGRSGRLRPAFSDGGLYQLMVPVKDLDVLGRCTMPADLSMAAMGVYCFTATEAGRVRARGLWPGVGVPEDPATGSAGAALGLYLADRVGDIEVEIVQGVEIGRPSRMLVRAGKEGVRVGGRCLPIFTGRLEVLPGT